ITKAVPKGRCVCTNLAVANDDVHKRLSSTLSPICESSSRISRGVKRELLVRIKYGRPVELKRSKNLSAPGIIAPSRISTPSMSQSQLSAREIKSMYPLWTIELWTLVAYTPNVYSIRGVGTHCSPNHPRTAEGRPWSITGVLVSTSTICLGCAQPV